MNPIHADAANGVTKPQEATRQEAPEAGPAMQRGGFPEAQEPAEPSEPSEADKFLATVWAELPNFLRYTAGLVLIGVAAVGAPMVGAIAAGLWIVGLGAAAAFKEAHPVEGEQIYPPHK